LSPYGGKPFSLALCCAVLRAAIEIIRNWRGFASTRRRSQPSTTTCSILSARPMPVAIVSTGQNSARFETTRQRIVNHGCAKQKPDLTARHAYLGLVNIFLVEQVAL
jgi:hypothetical protein